ncbi:MAG: phosphotransferase family protein [Acidimicrobiales bacterium]|nr:phosphotransferase family protein [Acidimicrobiales bacterium]
MTLPLIIIGPADDISREAKGRSWHNFEFKRGFRSDFLAKVHILITHRHVIWVNFIDVTDLVNPGIDESSLSVWLQENVAQSMPPYDYQLVDGGRSNLSYIVSDSTGSKFLLRRPPVSHVLASAHDMKREYRVMEALRDTLVPVPAMYAFCSDEAVNGAPFYVMEYVEGFVLRDKKSVEDAGLDVAERKKCSSNLVQVLANLHQVDYVAVHLDNFGKPGGYIARQVARWNKQFLAMCEPSEEPYGVINAIYEKLEKNIPRETKTTIVHGDFRLDNTVVSKDGEVKAVLDWELSTLGDPLADLALLLVYWVEKDSGNPLLVPSPSAMEGFYTKAEVVESYVKLTGQDVSNLDFYVAFSYYKLACILQGVLTRYRLGARAGDSSGAEGFAKQIVLLADMATEALDKSLNTRD